MRPLISPILLVLTAGLLAFTPMQASATLITSLPEGSLVAMPSAAYFGAGEKEVAPGVDWSSTTSSSVFGYSGTYGFTKNGLWSGLVMSGLNSLRGTMTFAFDAPVNGVGAFLNYVPNLGITPTIAVYDEEMNLLEKATLAFNTGGGINTGRFFGFSGENIGYFTLSDAYVGIANLTVSYPGELLETDYPGVLEGGILGFGPTTIPVPEPGTVLLLGAGLIGAGVLRRKTKK